MCTYVYVEYCGHPNPIYLCCIKHICMHILAYIYICIYLILLNTSQIHLCGIPTYVCIRIWEIVLTPVKSTCVASPPGTFLSRSTWEFVYGGGAGGGWRGGEASGSRDRHILFSQNICLILNKISQNFDAPPQQKRFLSHLLSLFLFKSLSISLSRSRSLALSQSRACALASSICVSPPCTRTLRDYNRNYSEWATHSLSHTKIRKYTHTYCAIIIEMNLNESLSRFQIRTRTVRS